MKKQFKFHIKTIAILALGASNVINVFADEAILTQEEKNAEYKRVYDSYVDVYGQKYIPIAKIAAEDRVKEMEADIVLRNRPESEKISWKDAYAQAQFNILNGTAISKVYDNKVSINVAKAELNDLLKKMQRWGNPTSILDKVRAGYGENLKGKNSHMQYNKYLQKIRDLCNDQSLMISEADIKNEQEFNVFSQKAKNALADEYSIRKHLEKLKASGDRKQEIIDEAQKVFKATNGEKYKGDISAIS